MFIARYTALLVISFSLLSSHTLACPDKRIEEALFVELGGLEQWITIRGDNDQAPVLLLLHGGPADAQSLWVDRYAPYEKNFILVQWDQRGAGRTYGKYRDQTPDITLDRIVSDGIELAEYLKNHFSKNGIILLGHSWGTAITTGMVTKRPDLFIAYVGTGQIASWAESVHWQFDFLKTKAKTEGDTVLLAELEEIGKPDPTNTKQYFSFARSLRKYMNASDAGWFRDMQALSKKLPKTDLDDLGNGMLLSGPALLPDQVKENFSTTSLRSDIPYYVIQGRDDLFTPTEPAARYFSKILAPKKQMVILENAGHFGLVTHPQEFLEALMKVLSF